MKNILEAIGNVPLIRLEKLSSGNVYAKAEYLNPGGSIKDRVAKYIIEAAIKDGKLEPGMIILQATSGNTGIGLSLVGVQKGFRVICVMPENVSEERKKIIQAFGGGSHLSPQRNESLSGCLEKLQAITDAEPG